MFKSLDKSNRKLFETEPPLLKKNGRYCLSAMTNEIIEYLKKNFRHTKRTGVLIMVLLAVTPR